VPSDSRFFFLAGSLKRRINCLSSTRFLPPYPRLTFRSHQFEYELSRNLSSFFFFLPPFTAPPSRLLLLPPLTSLPPPPYIPFFFLCTGGCCLGIFVFFKEPLSLITTLQGHFLHLRPLPLPIQKPLDIAPFMVLGRVLTTPQIQCGLHTSFSVPDIRCPVGLLFLC